MFYKCEPNFIISIILRKNFPCVTRRKTPCINNFYSMTFRWNLHNIYPSSCYKYPRKTKKYCNYFIFTLIARIPFLISVHYLRLNQITIIRQIISTFNCEINSYDFVLPKISITPSLSHSACIVIGINTYYIFYI